MLLLLGLRAPLAAATVTLVGAATVLAAYGLMALLGRVIDNRPDRGRARLDDRARARRRLLAADPRPLPPAAERAADADPRDAALAATDGGRDAPDAPCCSPARGLILALLLATAIAPTKILASLGIGVLLCSALAVGGAVVVMPAALALFGRALSTPAAPAPRRG